MGIGYFYGVLQRFSNQGSTGAHASVIVGRKFNSASAKCEYLIRDSYGASCKQDDGSDKYALPCENGSVWVEAQKLLKDTLNLTWIR